MPYASQGGTAELNAQELQRTLQDELHDHDQDSVPVITTCQYCQEPRTRMQTKIFLRQPHGLYIFVVSTTGIGEPPDHARDFYQWIMTTTTIDEEK
jgi:sulfite reductase alpha subunit-like flavoprotein